MAYDGYTDVARQSDAVRRQLLQSGDAAERVWAAWSLGVSLGGLHTPDLLASLDSSPEPGTRRHLLVIVAGLGERAIVQTFAQDDPDEHVRATAVQYLLRIGQPADVALQRFVRARLLADPSAAVKQAILLEAPLAYPAFERSDLLSLLRHPERDIRSAAVDRLLATASADQLFPGPLEKWIVRENDPVLRQRLATLCLAHGGAPRLLAACEGLDVERGCEILQLVDQTGSRWSWQTLGALARLDRPDYDVLLLSLLDEELGAEAVAWWFAVIARAARMKRAADYPSARLVAAVQRSAWQAEQRLFAVAPQLGKLGVAAGGEVLALVLARIDDELAQLEREQAYEEWDPDAYAAARGQREQLRAVIERMRAAASSPDSAG